MAKSAGESGEIKSLGSFRFVLIAFLISRLVLEVIGVLSVFYFPPASSVGPTRDLHYHKPVSPFIGMWARWDSEWFLLVAEQGYRSYEHFKDSGGGKYLEQETAKIFPAYPMGVRYLTILTKNSVLSGIILSNFSALMFLYYLFRLASRLFDVQTSIHSTMLYILFPTGFFLSAVYSESLFLAAITASLFYIEDKKLAPALLAIVIAMLTRSQAFLAIPPLLCLAWMRFPERRMAAVLLVGLTCLVPLSLYLAFVAQTFGSPKWITETVRYWRGDTLYPLYALVRFFRHPMAIHGQHNSIIDFSFALFNLGILAVSFRKLPFPYYLYSIIFILFPLSSTLFSFSRLCLANFPMFLFLGQSSWGRSPLLSVSFAMLQAFFFAAFANWYWVG